MQTHNQVLTLDVAGVKAEAPRGSEAWLKSNRELRRDQDLNPALQCLCLVVIGVLGRGSDLVLPSLPYSFDLLPSRHSWQELQADLATCQK